MLPTVFLKNNTSIVLEEMQLRLGNMSRSFPNRALQLTDPVAEFARFR